MKHRVGWIYAAHALCALSKALWDFVCISAIHTFLPCPSVRAGKRIAIQGSQLGKSIPLIPGKNKVIAFAAPTAATELLHRQRHGIQWLSL